jgi:hypothetical protein
MQLSREALRQAVERGILTAPEADALWTHLAGEPEAVTRGPWAAAPVASPPFSAAAQAAPWKPLAAALAVAVVAAALLLGAFDRYGFGGLAVAAGTLAGTLLAAGRHRHLKSGGALGHVFISSAVLFATLAVHGLVRALGHGTVVGGGALRDWLLGSWFPVQATAVAATVLALRSFRIPFLSAILAASIWFAAQDAAPVLFGDDPGWGQRALLSALTGLVLLAAGLAVDRRTRDDHAFWLYLPGLLALSGGLVTWHAASESAVLAVLVINAALVLASLLLQRRSFAVAGALGMAAAAGHLADDLLDAQALSFALAAIALAVIGLALLYHLHHHRLERLLASRVPPPLRRLLPPGV